MTIKTLKEKLDSIKGLDESAIKEAISWGANALNILHHCALSKAECTLFFGKEFGSRLHTAYRNNDGIDKFMFAVIRYFLNKTNPSKPISQDEMENFRNNMDQANQGHLSYESLLELETA